jgi:hypothetical protein
MCGGKINGTMKGNANTDTGEVVMNLVLGSVTAYVVKMAADWGGAKVPFVNSSPFVSGGVKLGLAVGAAVLMPEILESAIGTGTLIGMGTSGIDDIYEGAKASFKGIGFVNHSRFTNPKVAGADGGVEIKYS